MRTCKPGGALAIDTTRAYSGTHSLKAHIDGGGGGGGRQRASGALFGSDPPAPLRPVRAMWNANDASSIHWTLFGASGVVPAGSPSAGHTTTYLFSAADDKKFMAVFYDNQTQQDCWNHATEPVPVATATDH
ncbi:MAG: hypothetical protein IPQ07_38615 [Myxococcales bacterium]|nr:hypothetical protein [Myxococcales bacterium]